MSGQRHNHSGTTASGTISLHGHRKLCKVSYQMLALLIASAPPLLWSASGAHAGSGSYACTIMSLAQVDERGVPSSADVFAAKVGDSFVVDRRAGRISGHPLFDNDSGDNTILEPGNQEMSFQLLSRVGFRTNYLVVQEFAAKAKKPFVMIDYGDIYTGVCD